MNSIPMSALEKSFPSLCVPRVFPNISKERITATFAKLNLGTISQVVLVPGTDPKGTKFNRVFVHFTCWNSSAETETFRSRIIEGKDIKIVYDDPWFWKVFMNKTQKNAVSSPTPTYIKKEKAVEVIYDDLPVPVPAPAPAPVPVVKKSNSYKNSKESHYKKSIAPALSINAPVFKPSTELNLAPALSVAPALAPALSVAPALAPALISKEVNEIIALAAEEHKVKQEQQQNLKVDLSVVSDTNSMSSPPKAPKATKENVEKEVSKMIDQLLPPKKKYMRKDIKQLQSAVSSK